MHCVRSNNISLKYQRFTSSGGKDIGIRKFRIFMHLKIQADNLNIFF